MGFSDDDDPYTVSSPSHVLEQLTKHNYIMKIKSEMGEYTCKDGFKFRFT